MLYFVFLSSYLSPSLHPSFESPSSILPLQPLPAFHHSTLFTIFSPLSPFPTITSSLFLLTLFSSFHSFSLSCFELVFIFIQHFCVSAIGEVFGVLFTILLHQSSLLLVILRKWYIICYFIIRSRFLVVPFVV